MERLPWRGSSSGLTRGFCPICRLGVVIAIWYVVASYVPPSLVTGPVTPVPFSVAPGLIVTGLAMTPVILAVPASIVSGPLLLLLPDTVHVPVPILLNPNAPE